MKKLVKFLFVLIMMLLLVSCKTKNIDCDSIKASKESYSYNLSDFKLKDVTIDLYKDGNVVGSVSLNKSYLSSEDYASLSTEGRHKVTVNYNNQTTVVTIDLWGSNTNQTFTVCFYNGDKLMDTQIVSYGEEAVYDGKRPSKAQTEDYEYIFSGWDQEIGFVVSDIDTNAVFTEKSLYYTVKFYALDGSLLKEYDNVKKESGVEAPEMPERVGYTFDGWDQNYNFVIEDLECHPVYTPIKYTITLLPNIECSTCKMPDITSYTIEDEVTLTNPTTEATFLGWYTNTLGYGEKVEKISKGSTGDVTLYAMLDMDPTLNQVTFVDFDGSIISQKEYKTGDAITAPTNLSRYGYSFAKWDKDYSNVKSDITIQAVYTPITYTVTYNVSQNNVTYYGSEKLDEYTIEDNYVLPYLSLTGYAFMGWYTDSNYTNGVTTLETGNYTLYARLDKLKEDDNFKLVITDEELCVGYSTRVYAKLGDEYIDPSEVTFDAGVGLTIDKTGFIVANTSGEKIITASYKTYKSSIKLNVTKEKGPIWVGHTGCIGKTVVANTEKAFIEGAQRGYYALECDLRISKDGVWFILHDSTFTTADTYTPFVQSSLDAAGIKTTDSLQNYNWSVLKDLLVHKLGNDSVLGNLCTLERYLEICKEYNCKAVIEIKWNNGLNSADNSLVPTLVNYVKSQGMLEKTIFMTSMYQTLEAIKSICPNANMQLLTSSTTTTQTAVDWCIANNAGLDAAMGGLTEDIVKQIHAHNLFVNAWTIDTQSSADKMFAIGVDMITTDSLGVN